MTEQPKVTMELESLAAYIALFGANDKNIAMMEDELSISLALRGSQLHMQGESVQIDIARSIIEKLISLSNRHAHVDHTTLRYALSLAKSKELDRLDDIAFEVVATTHRGRPIRCKTLGQHDYVRAIRDHKQVQLVVTLEEWDSEKNYDRIGMEEQYIDILGVSIPKLEIPVKPGRNIPTIIETASMNERLKKMGYNAAKEFNHNVLRWIESENARTVYFGTDDSI